MRIAPRPPAPPQMSTASSSAPSNTVASSTAASSLASRTDARADDWLGRNRPDDQRAELRAFAPVAARLARFQAPADVRPSYLEALELHILSSRLASFASSGARSLFDPREHREVERTTSAELRNPATNVLGFLMGGKQIQQLTEVGVLATIGVSPDADQPSIDAQVSAYIAKQRAHLAGTAELKPTPRSAPSPQPATTTVVVTAQPAPRAQPAPLLSHVVYVAAETSGPFRDPRPASEQFWDWAPRPHPRGW